MSNILLIILCFLLGIIFRRFSEIGSNDKIGFPPETPKVLNAFIIYISLPSLILLHIHSLKFEWSMIALMAMPWILFVVVYFLIVFLGKIFHWDRNLQGSLILTSGLGNTSFVGLPMIEAYYGKEYVSFGLLADQAGTFLVLSTLGMITATLYSQPSGQNKILLGRLLKKVLVFPPFFVLMLTLFLNPLSYPDWFKEVLRNLGATLTPIALFSVGFQLRLQDFKGNQKYIFWGLFLKLIFSPLWIAFLYGFLDLPKEIYHISIFEAAMAPMITGGIVAINYNLNPPLVVLMLAIGIPLSFLTLPIFWYFFH
ncbi:MAG: AEC family transporter [Leptonema sp. (in: bacteria)]